MRDTNLQTGVSLMPEPADAGGYLPIAEHGLIGNLHTVALVGTEGTIDWYCCPRFDAPSLFGALLDRERGGYWRITPTGTDWTTRQLYFPDTNILITRFLRPPAPPSDTTPVVRARTGDLPRRGRAALRLRSAGTPDTPAPTGCGLR